VVNKCYQSGVCCKLFLINLNQSEYESKKFSTVFDDLCLDLDFKEAKKAGANILKQQENGSCVYFKDNGCSIHEWRPVVCREFFCSSKAKKFEGMVDQINQKKKLLGIKIR